VGREDWPKLKDARRGAACPRGESNEGRALLIGSGLALPGWSVGGGLVGRRLRRECPSIQKAASSIGMEVLAHMKSCRKAAEL
jgi:hypothetical protein